MGTNRKTTPIPLIHMDTKALYHHLKTAKDGDIIAYSTLSALINNDVQGLARGYLSSARRRLRQDLGLVFKPVLMDPENPDRRLRRGLKCLTDSEKAHLAVGTIADIHRSTARTIREMATADRSKLSRDDALNYDTGILALSTVRHLATAKTQEKVKALVDKNGSSMGYAALLERLAENQK